VVATKVRPCVEELSTDSDRDVRFFANRALRTCAQISQG
jgi:hypothetical protein